MAVIEDVSDACRPPFVRLAGELDSLGSERVKDVLGELLESGCSSPQLDMAGISFMDSAGLVTVLRWCQEFQDSQCGLEVVSINPIVKRLFELAGRADIIHSSEEHDLPSLPERRPIMDCSAAAGDWEMCSFTVAAILGSCKVVRDRVVRIAEHMPFCAEERGDVRIAVGEAISNAIRHGCLEKPSERVAIRCVATCAQLVVEISDHGPGFSPDGIEEAPACHGLPEGNMGIACMRNCVDEVSFHFDHGTTIRLVKIVRG